MGWKAGKSHQSGSMGGKSHFDVYHTDKSGKRDRSHSQDVKISGDSHKPSMRDVHSSSSGGSNGPPPKDGCYTDNYGSD